MKATTRRTFTGIDKIIWDEFQKINIPFYAGRKIGTDMDPEADTAYYNLIEDAITMSPKLVKKYKEAVEYKGKRWDPTTSTRTPACHETAHGILTPRSLARRMSPMDAFVENALEDERIETLTENYFLGVNFEEFKRTILEDVPADEISGAFLRFVRLHDKSCGTQGLFNRLQNWIYKNRNVTRDSYGYNESWSSLWRAYVNWWNRTHPDKPVPYYWNNQSWNVDNLIQAGRQNQQKQQGQGQGQQGEPKDIDPNAIVDGVPTDNPSGNKGQPKQEKPEDESKDSKGSGSNENKNESKNPGQEGGSGAGNEPKRDSDKEAKNPDNPKPSKKLGKKGKDGFKYDPEVLKTTQIENTGKGLEGDAGVRPYKDEKLTFNLKDIFSKVKARRQGLSASYHAYSGDKLDVRMFGKPHNNNWKIFTRGGEGSDKSFAKWHLNLFLDSSGSMWPNTEKINTLLKALSQIEKDCQSFFTWTWIDCSNGERVIPKGEKPYYEPDGGTCFVELQKVFDSVQSKSEVNLNVVLYDGDVSNAEQWVVFNKPNCIVIADDSCSNAIFRYMGSKPRALVKIIDGNYSEELSKTLVEALRHLTSVVT